MRDAYGCDGIGDQQQWSGCGAGVVGPSDAPVGGDEQDASGGGGQAKPDGGREPDVRRVCMLRPVTMFTVSGRIAGRAHWAAGQGGSGNASSVLFSAGEVPGGGAESRVR